MIGTLSTHFDMSQWVSSNFLDRGHNLIVALIVDSIMTQEIKIQTELPRDVKNCHNQRSPAPSNSVFFLVFFY